MQYCQPFEVGIDCDNNKWARGELVGSFALWPRDVVNENEDCCVFVFDANA